MPKILLINPHQTAQGGFSNAPLGLLYLAGMLRQSGFSDVDLIDGYLERFEGICAKIDDMRPDIVGITSYTPGRHKALQIASWIRSRYPKTLIVLGGAHPTIMWRQLLEHYPFIDLCGLGEGEMTMIDIASGKPFKDINGVAFLNEGKARVNTPRKYFENLDDIPFPAWDLCDLDKYPGQSGLHEVRGSYIDKTQPRVPMVTSRGCTGNCTFCSTWWIWKGYRHRSGKNVVDEMEMLYKKGYQHFVLEDDAMTLDRQPVIDMCDEIIKRDLKIAFFATTRVDAMDEEMASKLKEAGCYEVSLGIESGSPKILKTINKHIDLSQSKNAIKILKEAGIKTTALIMVGNMGETDETINETVKFLQETEVDEIGSLGMVWIMPGTRLYAECVRQGVIKDSYWLEGQETAVLHDGFDDAQLRKWGQAVITKQYV